jgi:hypothetical protein
MSLARVDRLAGSRRAGDEHQAAGESREPGHHVGYAEFMSVLTSVRNESECTTDRPRC